nr:hypothetical protein [Heyndrickxia coagulans]
MGEEKKWLFIPTGILIKGAFSFNAELLTECVNNGQITPAENEKNLDASAIHQGF